jgi:hypothetical protein
VLARTSVAWRAIYNPPVRSRHSQKTGSIHLGLRYLQRNVDFWGHIRTSLQPENRELALYIQCSESLIDRYVQDTLDNLSEELNEGYSKAFSAFFQEKLGTPSNRGYITFIDPGRAYIGYVRNKSIK